MKHAPALGLAAVAAILVSNAALAGDIHIGTDPTRFVTGTAVSGSFYDTYSFSLTGLSSAVASSVSIELSSIFDISNGVLSLWSGSVSDGVADTLLSSTGFDTTSTSLSVSELIAGNYYWSVSGDASGSAGGSYLFASSTAPVPEPSSYAMMLAGLGMLGIAVSRRLPV